MFSVVYISYDLNVLPDGPHLGPESWTGEIHPGDVSLNNTGPHHDSSEGKGSSALRSREDKDREGRQRVVQ